MPPLPRIRGTQVGLRDPPAVGRIKADIRSGRYAFAEGRGRIGGVIDRRGVYHVVEGHHRMAAALELLAETGDPSAVNELLRHGLWTAVDWVPSNSRPMPSRSWWGSFRNWLGW